MNNDRPAGPLLRWAGGKRWLANSVREAGDAFSPTDYRDPFLGGASVFLGGRWPSAVLGDTNAALIACYRGIAEDPSGVRRRLSELTMNRPTFEALKNSIPETDVEAAVRLLYLNRAAYGGIYRVNRSGQFNVPYSGDRSLTALLDGSKLELVSNALRSASLHEADFASILTGSHSGSLVYCDPPYSLPGGESVFRRYGTTPFTWGDQLRLSCEVRSASKRGSLVIVSNSAHPMVEELYAGAKRLVVHRPCAWTRKREPEAIYVIHEAREVQAMIAQRMSDALGLAS